MRFFLNKALLERQQHWPYAKSEVIYQSECRETAVDYCDDRNRCSLSRGLPALWFVTGPHADAEP